MAAPDREVYVLVGDGSYLMMAQEIVTSIQEGVRLDHPVLDNHGLRQHRRPVAVGRLRRVRDRATARRDPRTGQLDGDLLPVDFAANAASLGRARGPRLHAARRSAPRSPRHGTQTGTTAIVIPVDREQRVGGYESWWDVPIAEVSTIDAVQAARADYVRAKAAERSYL